VFAAGFGDPIFGVSFAWSFPLPRLASGLIEGVAEAADYGDPDGRSTIHQEAQAMIAAGQAPPLRSVIGAGFSTLSGARAYTLAGSFCHFLLRERGPERLRALYRSAGDFTGVYGESLEALELKWRAFLAQQPLDRAERARAEERFRRPAIFQKVCARELAARVADARARTFSAPDRAVALLESACVDDPGEPTFRLDLAEVLPVAGRSEEALALAAEVERTPRMTWPLRARALSLIAAIHFQAGRFAPAEEAVRRALELATDEGEERTGQAKLRALADPEARSTLGRVLFGDAPTRAPDAALALYLMGEFSRAFPDEALGPYLVARQLSWRDPRLALPQLGRACPEGATQVAKPLPPVFTRECLRMTGEAAFRAEDFARSRGAYQRLRDGAKNEAERLRAEDFLERIGWEEAGRKK
jgi:tetratricopeptide (TPR) repeat protein